MKVWILVVSEIAGMHVSAFDSEAKALASLVRDYDESTVENPWGILDFGYTAVLDEFEVA